VLLAINFEPSDIHQLIADSLGVKLSNIPAWETVSTDTMKHRTALALNYQDGEERCLLMA
jgi:hypothetical protein